MPVAATPAAAVAAHAPRDAGCLHCGEGCGDGGVRTGAGVFCCAGCASVFAVIHSQHLDAYYACELPPGISQRRRTPRSDDRLAILDRPDIAALFLTFTSPVAARATLSVPSMHCASCIWLVEQLWRVVPGVSRTEADIMRRVVRVDFDPSATSLRAVVEGLAALGYEPELDATRRARGGGGGRRLYLKIGVAGFAFGNAMLFSLPRYVTREPIEPGFALVFDVLNTLLAIPVLLYSASDYLRGAWAAVRGRAMTLDVPVAIGLVVMFGRSVVDVATRNGTGFFDSFTGLVFFLLIGRLLQQKAFDAIGFDRTLRSFLPLFVRVETTDGLSVRPVHEVASGDTLVIRPDEVVPADAELLDETAAIDYAFVTGERSPVPVRRGDEIRAGGRVVGQLLRARAKRPASESTLAQLWSHPTFDRTRHHWITSVSRRFGGWFTSLAIVLALAGAYAWWPDASTALGVATAVLIIACPCALTLASPITLGTAMGVLGRAGCFLKSPAVVLDLARIDTIAFDKTGTLSAHGVSPAVELSGLDALDWSRVRALARHSTHPVSRALAASGPAVSSKAMDVVERSGHGIVGTVGAHRVAIGTAGFVFGTAEVSASGAGGWTSVAVDDRLGRARLAPQRRPGVDEMLDRLRQSHDIRLLSGDHPHEAGDWRAWFPGRMAFRQLPNDKVSAVEAMRASGRNVLMVGDGVNDAGAFAAADVGMAVSDDTACLVPACDAVIRGGDLSRLAEFLAYARRARQVVLVAFLVSLAYNAVGLTLALRAELTPLATAVLMPASSLTVIGLSTGLMRWRTPEAVRP